MLWQLGGKPVRLSPFDYQVHPRKSPSNPWWGLPAVLLQRTHPGRDTPPGSTGNPSMPIDD
ncbi:MAG: hypothetical protein HC866_22935 [Leptolyngbyaceae cyanobacterium RU_5_1]|nr:hypothetical protein [Leptolyngbyaceae cyanobacterium RU_5_1]